MYIAVDNHKQEGAVSWGVDEVGSLDLYSPQDKVMKTIAPGKWETVERVLEDGEDWETYGAKEPIPTPEQAMSAAEQIARGIGGG